MARRGLNQGATEHAQLFLSGFDADEAKREAGNQQLGMAVNESVHCSFTLPGGERGAFGALPSEEARPFSERYAQTQMAIAAAPMAAHLLPAAGFDFAAQLSGRGMGFAPGRSLSSARDLQECSQLVVYIPTNKSSWLSTQDVSFEIGSVGRPSRTGYATQPIFCPVAAWFHISFSRYPSYSLRRMFFAHLPFLCPDSAFCYFSCRIRWRDVSFGDHRGWGGGGDRG